MRPHFLSLRVINTIVFIPKVLSYPKGFCKVLGVGVVGGGSYPKGFCKVLGVGVVGGGSV